MLELRFQPPGLPPRRLWTSVHGFSMTPGCDHHSVSGTSERLFDVSTTRARCCRSLRRCAGARRRLSFDDLFAGAGGISEGFRQAGWTPVAGSDIDPDACATYRHNFPEATTLWGDIREHSLSAQLIHLAGEVDIVAGRPPCQGFSQVRNHARLIDDPKNSLYREFVRLVGVLEPRAFVMENVPGMAQMGVLQPVEADLACGGRYVVHPMVLDVADFGVPQTRK